MNEIKKWANYIGLGAGAWWFIDVLLPFIPFGGFAFWIFAAWIIWQVLSHTLFKDSSRQSSSVATSSSVTDDRDTLRRADQLEI